MVLIENSSQNYYGHVEYDLKGGLFQSIYCEVPENNIRSDFFVGNSMEFINGILKE
jgi:hypothetical protein